MVSAMTKLPPPARQLRRGDASPGAFLRGAMRAARLAIFLAGAACGVAQAAGTPPPPELPPLGDAWRTENPYRGDARAVAFGKTLYVANCLRCHGEEASGRGPAADLRLVGRYCRQIADEPLRQRCARDADEYFRRSVLFGKVRLGIVHMPPWQDVLSQEAVWALRSYVETRGQ